MSATSSIEWTDATWNPVTGCDEISPGCDHCYARTFAERWKGTPGHYFERGFELTLRPEKLDEPLKWRKPRMVFVNSMSDLFHHGVPDEFIARVFATMAQTPQHTYQVLTKRPARMRSLLTSTNWRGSVAGQVRVMMPDQPLAEFDALTMPFMHGAGLPNVWLGVSTEDQRHADVRISHLTKTPAAVRFISAEPLLGPVELGRWQEHCPTHGDPDHDFDDGDYCLGCPDIRSLDWVIVGGESGPGARPMHVDWARRLRKQCVTAKIPLFFKQWGAWCPPNPDHGQSIFDHVTNGDACQVVSMGGQLLGRPWSGWKVQDGTRDAVVMRRYGKKKAGRTLDGRTWDEMPATLTPAAA